MFLRGREEVEAIRKAAKLVARTLEMLRDEMRPGVTTGTLDRLAEAFIRDHGGRPAFKGYRGFPASICPSVNDEVVHGIPGDRALVEGDIVGTDVGVELDGYFGDAAMTFPVGRIDAGAERLLQVTREALMKGVAQAKAGNRVGDISHAIQSHVEQHGFTVVRSLVGHGIGRQMHEEPQVPNYGTPDRGPRLMAGQVLAIEPMVNAGVADVVTREDGWTVVTKDGALSAHFEHTVAVGPDGPDILSLLE
ncbi:MAG: type I methionyl aminopeptidase [Candidatus Eisenbacteria bacterium]|uniref:Methionine aminopeptidase n=1 Tax=Eiseniibacteriota bacterium TaxID=2212470 RepID=A0A9D6L534_UNCEI|nr:type I methionyl aminopeptidase [Candidatus Eisenbacteria bacterium]MBI3538946.1 type I methionyl aminopeptidase [Candidatus Eisenbacteria bacterium]